MNDKQIIVVKEYKYFGCVVNEHLSCVRMVKERAKAGEKALSDWLRRCRVTVGDLIGETFMKLLYRTASDLVLLYEADVWGCSKQLAPIDRLGCRCCEDLSGCRKTSYIPKCHCYLN